ncbi:hypothetical protein LAD12857_40350 [Lacrimispora amygdalina]|uniref:Uncharacterized protein n=1 Tax=Lacrimispora amygdalina TaxID=253257 RepID=A0ABQ5MB96_9FIRM
MLIPGVSAYNQANGLPVFLLNYDLHLANERWSAFLWNLSSVPHLYLFIAGYPLVPIRFGVDFLPLTFTIIVYRIWEAAFL